ncbi:hypothetical protein [Bacillus sp. PS06]|uniref:hypothetical protein n=1 Tax=Bacillus sp. PS06 TaxID=2764176 RepID=UPI00178072C2|nr:hypothetical protein [Bacillus sp. PS06]MBD8070727.1 hypothetical protein [Bacillus sp. PS06]
MLTIKVKTKDTRFTIPIPSVILNVAVSILSSKLLQRQMEKWTKDHRERKNVDITIPQIDKNILKPILKELKKHKGLVLVDVKTSDGTEVKIRL